MSESTDLDRDYWRLGWVLLTNCVLAVLLLTGPIRIHHDRQLLYQAIRTTPPPFSYWKEFFTTAWAPLMTLILFIGIVAEVLRSTLSPVLNLAPYVVWLAAALWERARVAGEGTSQELFLGKVLLIIPLASRDRG
jgi:hypothetical protein